MPSPETMSKQLPDAVAADDHTPEEKKGPT